MMRSQSVTESAVPPVLGDTREALESRVKLTCALFLAALTSAIFSASFVLEEDLVANCASMQLFQFPCVFCGGTRAFAALSSLRLGDALRWNPLVTICAIGIIMGAIACLRKPALASRTVRWGWVWTALAVAGVLNWAYLIFYLPR
jgi:hypothetical protein